jgi:hypothetical protein
MADPVKEAIEFIDERKSKLVDDSFENYTDHMDEIEALNTIKSKLTRKTN